MNGGSYENGSQDAMIRRWEVAARLVSQIGFPIVVTAFLLYRFDVTIQGLAERLQQVSQSIIILTSEQRSTNDLLRARIQQSEEELKEYKKGERR